MIYRCIYLCISVSFSFRFDEVLYQSNRDLQPTHLVNFLTKLRWAYRLQNPFSRLPLCSIFNIKVAFWGSTGAILLLKHFFVDDCKMYSGGIPWMHLCCSHLVASALRELPVKGSPHNVAQVTNAYSLPWLFIYWEWLNKGSGSTTFMTSSFSRSNRSIETNCTMYKS